MVNIAVRVAAVAGRKINVSSSCCASNSVGRAHSQRRNISKALYQTQRTWFNNGSGKETRKQALDRDEWWAACRYGF